MESLLLFLEQWGDWGMFITALISGCYFPISSEVVMVALLAAGVNPWELFAYGVAGNIIGGMGSYYLGYICNSDKLERILRVKHDKLERAAQMANKHGALAAFFGWLPMLGSALLTTLGMMRTNVPITFVSMSAGKVVRYLIIILPYLGITLLVH